MAICVRIYAANMKRIRSFDMSRGLAIIFALASHGLSQFTEQIESVAASLVWVKLLTRSATPMFFVLFGLMLQLVYLRKAGTDFTATRERLIARSIVCYVLYVGITLAGVVSGKFDLFYFTKSLVMLETGRFGNILAYYAILFGLLALTLSYALRWRVWFFAGIAIAAWLARAALVALDIPPMPGVQQLIGHGSGFGPAILLTFTFIAFGVLLGEGWEKRRSWIGPMAVGLIATVTLIVAIARNFDMDYVYQLVFAFRWQNHPVYYAYGIAMTSVGILLMVAWGRTDRLKRTQNGLARLGSETLYAYALGSIVLNLLPEYKGASVIGIAMLAVYLVGMVVVTIYKAPVVAFANRATFGWVSGTAKAYRNASGALASTFVHK